ncbi:hypothetical protein HX001_02115 [Empedobacter brevis]|uniref:Uncharacterized protein n=1 Tax=Empedobacter brevis TaxID=247 RepID=A0AAJ1QC61_9FLAO|nr:hypothetical protein [Empedobacter brevis]MDM1071281.1 hypothetical protein [Empedobacter brevis]
MKKLFLSALACVAFAGSAFASNGIILKTDSFFKNYEEIKEKPCKISVKVRDKDGNSDVRYSGSAGNVSLSECDGIRSRFESDLRAQGFYFSDADVTLIWGVND